MKKIIALVSIAFAAPIAFACPDLTGTYACTTDGGESYVTTITTGMENGVQFYEMDGDKIYADGASRPFSNETMTGTYSATCAGNALDFAMDGNLLEAGQTVGTLQVVGKLTKSATGYGQLMEGQATYKGQQFPIQETTTCTLQ